jgi:pilus assembly protein CpaE
MSNVLRLAIVDPNDAKREALKGMLLGMDMIWLEAECSRYEFFGDVVAQTNPDIGLVAVDHDPARGLDLVGRLGASSPECAVLVVSSSNDGNLILRVLRAGAKEFLTQPVRIEDLLAALGRISERRFGRSGDNKPRGSQVIAVAGAIGGVGTTSIAVNLGCALARNERNSVALVDLDLCLGDADVFLDTIPDYTLVDVAQNVTRLDFSLLKRSLTKHSSGLYLLPRPVQLEDVALITPDDLQRVIGLLKATFTHLVLDLSKGYNALDLVALEMASSVLLVRTMSGVTSRTLAVPLRQRRSAS